MLRRSLAIFTLLVLASIPSFAGRMIVPSTDRLPLGDWTYDAMVSLASDGLIPGYAARLFEGDRLFDRMEMAQLVSLAIESSVDKELSSSQFELIDHLVTEFKPELTYFQPGEIEKWTGRTTNINLPMGQEAYLLGYVQGRITDDTADSSGSAVPYHVSLFAHLSDQAFAIATLSGNEQKFFQQVRRDRGLSKAFLQGTSGGTEWSVGRNYLEWGPMYSGSMIISDNSAAFDQARVSRDVEFGHLFGRVNIDEFASTFENEGSRVYLFGRRYEKPFNRNWHLGITEAALTSFRPNPLIAVMPFYLYQHVFHSDPEFNSVYGTDLAYVAHNGCEAYADLVIDDITAPRFLRPSHSFAVPRKAGLGAGFYVPDVFHDGRVSNFRAEYVTVDRLTYLAARAEYPQLSFTHDGDVIGSPIGPNAKAIYLRGERYFSGKFSAVAEYFNQWQTASGDPERGHQRYVSLTAAYDFKPNTSVSLRVAPFQVSPPGESSESGTKYELRASFGF